MLAFIEERQVHVLFYVDGSAPPGYGQSQKTRLYYCIIYASLKIDGEVVIGVCIIGPVSSFGPISQKLNCCGYCVILAKFQNFYCWSSTSSTCELFAMTGCSGDILKISKMTGAK